jgi:hypothetical protein
MYESGAETALQSSCIFPFQALLSSVLTTAFVEGHYNHLLHSVVRRIEFSMHVELDFLLFIYRVASLFSASPS